MRKFELLRTDADLPQNSKICVAVHITRGPTGIELLALWEKSPSHERGLTEPTEERVPLLTQLQHKDGHKGNGPKVSIGAQNRSHQIDETNLRTQAVSPSQTKHAYR